MDASTNPDPPALTATRNVTVEEVLLLVTVTSSVGLECVSANALEKPCTLSFAWTSTAADASQTMSTG